MRSQFERGGGEVAVKLPPPACMSGPSGPRHGCSQVHGQVAPAGPSIRWHQLPHVCRAAVRNYNPRLIKEEQANCVLALACPLWRQAT